MKKKDYVGIAGIVILTIVVGMGLSLKADSIYWDSMYTSTMHTIDQNLENLDTIDEKMEYIVELGAYPSTVAGIVVNDELVWTNAYGNANMDTVYNIGSVTKTFTATAILQLYDRNLLDLNADVNTYLPFPLRHPLFPDVPVTLRMLLTHHSGLQSNYFRQGIYDPFVNSQLLGWEAELLGKDYLQLDPLPTLGDFLEGYLTPGGAYYSPTVWTDSKPGTDYKYANVGFDLLGFIVEQVTYQSFTDYLQEHIWGPLNMTRTGGQFAEFAPNVAVGHERFYGVLSKTNVELPLHDRSCIGAGGIFSTLPDLAQFLIAHMNQGQVNGVQLLRPETVELMHQSAFSTSGKGDFGQVGAGLGWVLRNPYPGNYFNFRGSQGHGGATPGWTCQMWMVENEHGSYGFILMSNITQFYENDPLWILSTGYSMQEVLLIAAESLLSQN